MSERTLSILKKYGILSLSCLMVAVLYISAKDLSSLSLKEKYRVISDGFAIPGMLVTNFGLMFFVASKGALDGVLYGVRYMVLSLIPNGRKKIQKYGDYVEDKRKKRITGMGYFVHVGIVFCLISLIFVVLYNRV